MTLEELKAMGATVNGFLLRFRRHFAYTPTFEHFQVYVRGLLSDLPRKSVEPIALAAGATVRSLQEFLACQPWDDGAVRDEAQRFIAAEYLAAPGSPGWRDALGVVGWVDETSVAKKGDKTPGVQRQYCGATGKKDNCIVTVHLACKHGDFMALLDSDLFLPEESWHLDRKRCEKAAIPANVVYRPKWQIALEQLDRSRSNGIQLDWLVFDEGYGSILENTSILSPTSRRPRPWNCCCRWPLPVLAWSIRFGWPRRRLDLAILKAAVMWDSCGI